ncbi:malate dehydrogenase [Cryobacterium frigoriphilum]|uniref:Malate dehydrogenase n=1 Tax=Cryobacterium frigoriphilum TaxID=1259150 RepID=A0A4R8ZZZ5_9MICO|nr:malate dehydrogenase [Cryobacterium frigoriphilum]TFD49636.1 malate dehydrogenase [Cryobacterium frigoriphilum]
MTVYGTDDIDAVIASAGGAAARLTVRRGDIVTPLARDQAAAVGVEIIVTEAAAPAHAPVRPSPSGRAPGTAPATAPGTVPGGRALAPALMPSSALSPSPALYRRGAPLEARYLPRSRRTAVTDTAHGPGPGHGTPPGRVARIVVVGAGRVGMITAMRLAETDLVNEIVLVDVAGGLAAGIALDISHSAGLLGFSTRLRGEQTVAAAGTAAFTVVTAGQARRPGMSRGDLAGTNATIVGALAQQIAATSPDGVILVVTNPLDEMTAHAWRQSGLPSGRVIGMAGVLDTARFASLLSLTGIADASEIRGLALGSHGDEMVIPRSLVSVNGSSIDGRIDEAVLDGVVSRTRNSGAEVVGLLGHGSAFITPGLCAAQMVTAMIREDDRVVAATVRPNGQYGVDGTYVGLPVRLGRHGLASIVELDLTPGERRAIVSAASRISDRVRSLAGGHP